MPSDERREAESAESTLAPIKEWYQKIINKIDIFAYFSTKCNAKLFYGHVVMINIRHIEEKRLVKIPQTKTIKNI